MKLNIKKWEGKIGTVIVALYVQLLLESAAHADPIEGALNLLQGWLSTVIGSALVVIGATIVGIRMAAGDEDAWHKGKGVLIGGLIVFLAKAFLNVLRGWTGQ